MVIRHGKYEGSLCFSFCCYIISWYTNTADQPFSVLLHQCQNSNAEILNTWACSQCDLCHWVQQQYSHPVSDLAWGPTEINDWARKKNTSPGAQCNFSYTERHCQRSTRLCHRTCPNDSVQFHRMLNKILRKLSLLNSIGFWLRKIKGIFFPSCLIYTQSYKTSNTSLLFERQQLHCSKNPPWK